MSLVTREAELITSNIVAALDDSVRTNGVICDLLGSRGQ
jgi:hypothetical protein